MEAFENGTISTALHPPSMWKRYVDDTFVIQHHLHKEEILRHINPSIQFTVEEAKDDDSISFYGHHNNTINRWNLLHRGIQKSTHTDLYLP